METQTWVLIKNGKEVVEMATFDTEDIRVNGRGDVLEALIPLEHLDAAERGEWNPEGFVYTLDDGSDDWFEAVRYYPADADEEIEE